MPAELPSTRIWTLADALEVDRPAGGLDDAAVQQPVARQVDVADRDARWPGSRRRVKVTGISAMLRTWLAWSPARMVRMWCPCRMSPSDRPARPMSSTKRKPLWGLSLRLGIDPLDVDPAQAVAIGPAALRSAGRDTWQSRSRVGSHDGAVDQQLDVGDAGSSSCVPASSAQPETTRIAAVRGRMSQRAAQLGLRLGELDHAERRQVVLDVGELRWSAAGRTSHLARACCVTRDGDRVEAVQVVGGVELEGEAGGRRVRKAGERCRHPGRARP